MQLLVNILASNYSGVNQNGLLNLLYFFLIVKSHMVFAILDQRSNKNNLFVIIVIRLHTSYYPLTSCSWEPLVLSSYCEVIYGFCDSDWRSNENNLFAFTGIRLHTSYSPLTSCSREPSFRRNLILRSMLKLKKILKKSASMLPLCLQSQWWVREVG